MSNPNFPSQHTTTTTVTMNSQPRRFVTYSSSYIRKKEGILKILQVASSFLAFICIQCSQFSIHPIGKWFSVVSMFGVWVTGILLVLYMFQIVEKCDKIPWIKFELFYCAILALCLLIASSLAAPQEIPAFEAAAFFGFCAMVVYAFDAFLKYSALRSGATVQRDHQKETTTVTTPKY